MPLKDKIEEFIQAGLLQHYVAKNEQRKPYKYGRPREQSPVERSPKE